MHQKQTKMFKKANSQLKILRDSVLKNEQVMWELR